MNISEIRSVAHVAGSELATASHLVESTAEPLRATVLYTQGKALGGAAQDDRIIMDAMRARGMIADTIDLSHLSRHAQTGEFLLTDPATGIAHHWDVPDAVLMYHGALAPPNTGPMLDALDGAGAFVFNGRSAWETMTDKWKFFEVMDQAGARTIPTRHVTSHADALAAADEFGGRMVLKKPISTEGDDVYVLKDRSEIGAVTSRLDELGGRLIAQPFVESKVTDQLEPAIMAKIGRTESLGMRNDFRIMTVKDQQGHVDITGVFMRIAQHPEQEVNNVAKGARAVRINFSDLHPQDQQTMRTAVDALPDGHVVGWDLIGAPGERYIMEANSGPGLPTMTEGFDPSALVGPYARLAEAGGSAARAARMLKLA